MMRCLLLTVALLPLAGCGPKVAPNLADGVEDRALPDAEAAPVPPALPTRVDGFACLARGCVVWSGDSLRPLTAQGTLGDARALGQTPTGVLDVQDGGLAWLAPCEGADLCASQLDGSGQLGEPRALELAPAADPRTPLALAEEWNDMRARELRVPFRQRVPTRDQGTLSYLRGASNGSAQLVRTGSRHLMEAVPAVPGAASYPRWLAMHPTGRESFLMVWPDTILAAIDPDSLDRRWELHLRGPAHGLFIDATGRWLVLAEGGTRELERILDFDALGPDWPADRDPSSDAALLSSERPGASAVVVVDLSGPRIATRLTGEYRGFGSAPDGGVWVATSDGLSPVASGSSGR